MCTYLYSTLMYSDQMCICILLCVFMYSTLMCVYVSVFYYNVCMYLYSTLMCVNVSVFYSNLYLYSILIRLDQLYRKVLFQQVLDPITFGGFEIELGVWPLKGSEVLLKQQLGQV